MSVISVVIAARNEAPRLPLLLADLASSPQLITEVLVVDGGSRDATATAARLAGARLLSSPPARGGQLVLGAEQAQGRWLWFLHADARLPRTWAARLSAVVAQAPSHRLEAWCFDLQVDLPGPGYRLLELAVALRSQLGQRPYGDQGLLIERASYGRCGGLRPLPLMEDLEFAERFCAMGGRFRSLNLPLRVDGRRWRRLGLVRTALANAALRRAWRRGVPLEHLARRYGGQGGGQGGA